MDPKDAAATPQPRAPAHSPEPHPEDTPLSARDGDLTLLPQRLFEQLTLVIDPPGEPIPAYHDGRQGRYRNTDPARPSLIPATNDWEAVRCFLQDKALAGSRHTVRAYERECLRLLLWCRFVARKPLSSLNRTDAQNYQLFLKAPADAFVHQPDARVPSYRPTAMVLPNPAHTQGGDAPPWVLNPQWRPFRKKSLSEASIRSALAALKSLSKFLVNADYLTTSPFTLGKLARSDQNAKQRVRQRALGDGPRRAVETYLDALPDATAVQRLRGLRRRFIVDVFFYLGLRMDEARRATMSDFFLENKRWWLRTVGKGGKARTVPVPGALYRSLQDYRLAMDFDTADPLPTDTRPLIASVNGLRSLTDVQIRRLLKEVFAGAADRFEATADPQDPEAAATLSALRAATPHWWRHTYTTSLFDSGSDPANVQASLGHTSLDTTMIYRHTEDAQRHREADRLGPPGRDESP